MFQNIGVNMNITPTIRTDNLVSLNIGELNVTDVSRIDNVYGDRNLFCSCIPLSQPGPA